LIPVIRCQASRTARRIQPRSTSGEEFYEHTHKSCFTKSLVSKSKRDRHRDYEEKRREYLELGIHEYWLIDRFRRILSVFRRQPYVTGSEETLIVAETEVYRTGLLPGFELPLGRLLAIADRWQ
jgi:hypothetical protein